MSQKVEILAKVISELHLTLPELDDLIQKINSLFWDEAEKEKELLSKQEG
jgi:hypothetical protein